MSLRRIKLIQRTSNTLQKAILPLEISALNKNQSSSTFLILSFLPTNNLSSLCARFDVKSDKGSASIDIRPPLCEMLGPLKLKESEFDTFTKKLSGPHQKMTSKFESHDEILFSIIEKFGNMVSLCIV